MENANIHDRLNKNPLANLNESYVIIENTIKAVIYEHMPITRVIFDKHKHEKKWITTLMIFFIFLVTFLYVYVRMSNQCLLFSYLTRPPSIHIFPSYV